MPRLTPQHYETLVKIFKKAGFVQNREKGSHIIMNREDVGRPIIIPKYSEIGIDIINPICEQLECHRKSVSRS